MDPFCHPLQVETHSVMAPAPRFSASREADSQMIALYRRATPTQKLAVVSRLNECRVDRTEGGGHSSPTSRPDADPAARPVAAMVADGA